MNINNEQILFEINELHKALPKVKKDINKIINISQQCISSLEQERKIFCCGNGGSASNALHFAADVVGRFKFERDGLPCISLGSNYAIYTALSNDYSYENIFAKELSALGKEKDTLIVFSSSGNSLNIINVLKVAKEMGIYSIALLGKNGGEAINYADRVYIVDSDIGSVVEEVHQLLVHCICQQIEQYFFGEDEKYV